jgi:hypothetical protein
VLNPLASKPQCIRQPMRQSGIALNDVEGDTLSGTGSNARQFVEGGDQL